MSCHETFFHYFQNSPQMPAKRKAKSLSKSETKIAKLVPSLFPEYRDIVGLIANHLPQPDVSNLSVTCKIALEMFKPKKYTFKDDISGAKSWDILFISDQEVPDPTIIKEKFSKFRAIEFHKDLVKVGLEQLFPIFHLHRIFPRLESLDIYTGEELYLYGISKSMKRLRIFSKYEPNIVSDPSFIQLDFSLEELAIYSPKDTYIKLEHTNIPGEDRIKVKRLYGQCTLIREFGEGFPNIGYRKGSGIRETIMTLVKGKVYSV